MGKICSKLFFKKRMFVIIIGLDLSGKTTILYKFILDEDINTVPTLGINQEYHTYNNTDIQLYDLGGIKKIRSIWGSYCDYPNIYRNNKSN